METIEEIQGEIDGIIATLDQLIKLPASFRANRQVENQFRELLLKMRKDVEELASKTPDISKDLQVLDSEIKIVQDKLNDIARRVGEIYEKSKQVQS